MTEDRNVLADIADLTYDPPAERLTGMIGTTAIDMRACSGGYRGALDQSRWLDTPESRDPEVWGGPTPFGRYDIVWLGAYNNTRGVSLGLCCFLHPDPPTRARITASGRVWNDFLIHQPGRIGSLGCIVPWPRNAFDDLMRLLQGEVDERRGSLTVVSRGSAALP